jgi:hypothetical protein
MSRFSKTQGPAIKKSLGSPELLYLKMEADFSMILPSYFRPDPIDFD